MMLVDSHSIHNLAEAAHYAVNFSLRGGLIKHLVAKELGTSMQSALSISHLSFGVGS